MKGRKGKPQLEPGWLVGLLNQWALRSVREQSRSIGWYGINPMLKDGIPVRARSYEPTGYGDADFKDINNAVFQLDYMRRLAIVRYFKPWARAAVDAEIARDNDTWMYHLKIAMETLARQLDRDRATFAEFTLALDSFCGYNGGT